MRILVVEDETGIANFIREGLKEESFAVDVSSNGKEGLQLALSNEYDLILLDWMLPGLSGIEICRQLRKENTLSPIIFLTAKDTVDETVFALEAGANDYIKKPFAFEELLVRIRVQLRTQASENSSLRFKGIELNANAHTVTRDSIPVSLTQKEFALLEFLLSNKGKVCSRTKIIEHVWDLHFDADTSVIDVYVNFLRKKLDEDLSDSFIHTVRGVGYIIQDEK